MTNATAKAPQSFNLASLLKDPSLLKKITHKVPLLFDAEGKGYAGVVIVGKNSDEYQDVTVGIRVSNMQKSATRQKNIDTSTEEGAQELVDAIKDGEHMTAVAVTVDLYGFDNDGNDIEFNRDLVASMYNSCPQWRARVINSLDNDANFTMS